MDTCRIDGCEKPVRVKKFQLCVTHYARFNRHGDPLAWKRPKRPTCSVDGCDFKAVGGGLCDLHYRRQRRYGTTDRPERPTVCAVDGCERPCAAHGLCELHYRRQRRGDTEPQTCAFCGGLVPDGRRRKFCSRECQQREQAITNRANYRQVWLKRYGLTVETYDALWSVQGSRCAVCGRTEKPKRGWHVDHDHVSGRVRGILCHQCNVGLGHFSDDPKLLAAAIEYLSAPT